VARAYAAQLQIGSIRQLYDTGGMAIDCVGHGERLLGAQLAAGQLDAA
jgi:hypothetical protein